MIKQPLEDLSTGVILCGQHRRVEAAIPNPVDITVLSQVNDNVIDRVAPGSIQERVPTILIELVVLEAERMKKLFHETLEAIPEREGASVTLDQQALEQLRSLGYVERKPQ